MSLLNHTFGNVSCGSISQDVQLVTGAGTTTAISSSVGYVFVNAATAGETLVLPKIAEPGHKVTIIQTVGTNATVVSEATGSTILGSSVSATHDAVGEHTMFVFVSASLGWGIIGATSTVA